MFAYAAEKLASKCIKTIDKAWEESEARWAGSYRQALIDRAVSKSISSESLRYYRGLARNRFSGGWDGLIYRIYSSAIRAEFRRLAAQ